ncbi:MAG: cytochrome c [bacterium]|nr:MAG: cytochrome c [bacterium]
MENKIEIYQSRDNQAKVEVRFDKDTVWLSQSQIVSLFERDQSVISRHINNVFKEGELDIRSNMQKMHIPNSDKPVAYYNLDVIISVGYRVKSLRGTQFRIWATQRLKDYLVQGYAINENRLEQKNQEVRYLKTGIRILSRAIEQKAADENNEWLKYFAKGLELLDDYDHKKLDKSGRRHKNILYPQYEEYLSFIVGMRSEFQSDVFARPKDESFLSSINQIRQSFDGKDLYPSLEEKAATLLYLIVKNHSFVDGNKRIAAACFLLFLKKNNALYKKNGEPVISNETLASLTLFTATSQPDEMDIVKRFIMNIMNRN